MAPSPANLVQWLLHAERKKSAATKRGSEKQERERKRLGQTNQPQKPRSPKLLCPGVQSETMNRTDFILQHAIHETVLLNERLPIKH